MDYLTQQLIAAARRLRSDIKEIGSTLSSVGEQLQEIKNSAEAIAKTTKAYEKKEQPPPIVRAELHTPQAAETKAEAKETRQQRRDRVRLTVEWLTLFAVVAYGYVAFRQWGEMKVATKAGEIAATAAASSAETARMVYIATNRPFVGVADVESEDFPQICQVRFFVEFKNFGSVPATNVNYEWKIFVAGQLQTGYGKPQPITLFPQASISLRGIIGCRDHDDVQQGRRLSRSEWLLTTPAQPSIMIIANTSRLTQF